MKNNIFTKTLNETFPVKSRPLFSGEKQNHISQRAKERRASKERRSKQGAKDSQERKSKPGAKEQVRSERQPGQDRRA